MSERVIARVVWVVAVLAIAASVFGFWIDMDQGAFDGSVVSIIGAAMWTLLPAVFVLTGAVIVSRQPRNIIGLLLMTPGLIFVAAGVADFAFGSLEHGVQPDEVTVGLWLRLWFDNWSWVLLIFPVFHILVVFPTGRLLSSRWRWVAGLELVMVLTMLLGAAFGQEIGPLNVEESNAWTVPNPVGFLPAEFFGATFEAIWGAGLAVMTVVSLAAIVVRFRRGNAVEREQLKWLLFAVSMFALVFGGAAVTGGELASGGWGDLLFVLSVIAIPVSIGIAVLRYRLFDIDLIIRRTLLYAVVTGLLIGVYVLSVFTLQTLIGGVVGEGSPLAVAASTLLIAALFNPLRRRLQEVIDRRLYRSKYDAQRVIDGFVVTARDEADMARLSANLLDLVDQTVRPGAKGLWVKGAEPVSANPPSGSGIAELAPSSG